MLIKHVARTKRFLRVRGLSACRFTISADTSLKMFKERAALGRNERIPSLADFFGARFAPRQNKSANATLLISAKRRSLNIFYFM